MKKYYEKKEINKPIFILGPERSGTTLLYSLLSNANDVYWLSRIDSVFPSTPFFSQVLRSFFSLFEQAPFSANYRGVSSISGINTPSECIPYWKKVFKFGVEEDYNINNDKFTWENITAENKSFLIDDFRKRLYYSNKDRLLFKQPGFSLKVSYWNALFKDAHYLVCVRSIEDNIRSYRKAKEQSNEMFWGTKVPGWRNYYKESRTLQAAYQLVKIYEHMSDVFAGPELKDRFLVVPYENMICSPRQMMDEVLSFSCLEWNTKMEKSLEAIVQKEQVNILAKGAFQEEIEILFKLKKESAEMFSEIYKANE